MVSLATGKKQQDGKSALKNNPDKKTKVKKVETNDYDDESPEEEEVRIKSKEKRKFRLPSLSRKFGKQQKMVQ